MFQNDDQRYLVNHSKEFIAETKQFGPWLIISFFFRIYKLEIVLTILNSRQYSLFIITAVL